MDTKKRVDLITVRWILGVLLALVVGLAGGFTYGKRIGEIAALQKTSLLSAVMNKEGKSDVDFSLFWQVWGRLESSYVDSKAIDTQKMVYGAIKGMTAALDDPYTTFLAPSENKQSKEDLAGEFAGVGIELGYKDKTLAVVAPLADHPAQRAGIKAGDLILHIKDEKKKFDKDTEGMNLPEAVEVIRGKKGEEVTLTIYHEGDKQTKEVKLIRDTINVPSVELVWLNEKGEKDSGGAYAQLRVSRFGEKTASEWNSGVTQILARKGVKGIVLDLRNNPGGYLQRAVDLASEFVNDGVIVSQQGKETTESLRVDRVGRLIGRPLVVLINKGSASASEILAGALRDLLAVKLVGENSFGKGTVQEAAELPGGAGLHVTIAKWLLPSGKNIHKVGLKPDLEVKEATEAGAVDVQLVKAIELLPR